MHQLSRVEARRVAVSAQRLTSCRPGALLELVRHLTLLQYDQTTAVVPSPDLVAWSRMGSEFQRADLAEALQRQELIEVHMMLRPADDLRLFTAEMAAWPGINPTEGDRRVAAWVEANDGCRLDVLDRLRREGPLPMAALPDTCVRSWRSSGWNNHQNLRMLLTQLIDRGEVAVAGREGRDRIFDLAERVYPDDEPVPLEEALAERDRRRLAALGIVRATTSKAGELATIDGVPGRWRIDPTYLDHLDDAQFKPRTALLSPLDRLVFDRKRMTDVFDFDYQLEMYKPAAQRRWGYWALPILHGDQLVGKLDATAEPNEGVLRVDAVHEDGRWTTTMRTHVDAEIEALASWLHLDVVRPGAE